MSLRQPLPLHERTRHGAMRPRWRDRTPALAQAWRITSGPCVSCSRPNLSRWIRKVLAD